MKINIFFILVFAHSLLFSVCFNLKSSTDNSLKNKFKTAVIMNLRSEIDQLIDKLKTPSLNNIPSKEIENSINFRNDTVVNAFKSVSSDLKDYGKILKLDNKDNKSYLKDVDTVIVAAKNTTTFLNKINSDRKESENNSALNQYENLLRNLHKIQQEKNQIKNKIKERIVETVNSQQSNNEKNTLIKKLNKSLLKIATSNKNINKIKHAIHNNLKKLTVKNLNHIQQSVQDKKNENKGKIENLKNVKNIVQNQKEKIDNLKVMKEGIKNQLNKIDETKTHLSEIEKIRTKLHNNLIEKLENNLKINLDKKKNETRIMNEIDKEDYEDDEEDEENIYDVNVHNLLSHNASLSELINTHVKDIHNINLNKDTIFTEEYLPIKKKTNNIFSYLKNLARLSENCLKQIKHNNHKIYTSNLLMRKVIDLMLEKQNKSTSKPFFTNKSKTSLKLKNEIPQIIKLYSNLKQGTLNNYNHNKILKKILELNSNILKKYNSERYNKHVK